VPASVVRPRLRGRVQAVIADRSWRCSNGFFSVVSELAVAITVATRRARVVCVVEAHGCWSKSAEVIGVELEGMGIGENGFVVVSCFASWTCNR
jgi:hypothetical protein